MYLPKAPNSLQPSPLTVGRSRNIKKMAAHVLFLVSTSILSSALVLLSLHALSPPPCRGSISPNFTCIHLYKHCNMAYTCDRNDVLAQTLFCTVWACYRDVKSATETACITDKGYYLEGSKFLFKKQTVGF